MKKLFLNIGLLLSCILGGCFMSNAYAGASKRIEVYTISQNFWDVMPGDTLDEIIAQLLPDNPAMQKTLLNNILQLNSEAFINSNPHRLKANVRLWLPNSTAIMPGIPDKNKYDSQSFSWGQVHRIKRN